MATVQKSKIVDKAPEVESQYIPDIPSLPGVGGVNTPAPLPPISR